MERPRPDAAANEVDQLVGRLEDGRGSQAPSTFTVDEAAAREKLSAHQLADPWTYCLELVRAAVIKGAEQLDITVARDTLRLRWTGGDPLDVADCDGLFGAALGSGAPRSGTASPAARARRQIGIALHAALSLPIQSFMLTSSDGERGVVLEAAPGVPVAIREARDLHRGTEVTIAYRRARRATFGVDGGEYADEAHLRHRLRFAEIPITVNGDRVSRGLTLQEDALAVTVWDDDAQGYRGIGGFHIDLKSSPLLLVKDSVWIHSEDLAVPPGFVAVVASQAVRLDISRSQVVQDEAMTRIRQAAESAGRRAHEQLDAEAKAQLEANREHSVIPMYTPRRLRMPTPWRHFFSMIPNGSFLSFAQAGLVATCLLAVSAWLESYTYSLAAYSAATVSLFLWGVLLLGSWSVGKEEREALIYGRSTHGIVVKSAARHALVQPLEGADKPVRVESPGPLEVGERAIPIVFHRSDPPQVVSPAWRDVQFGPSPAQANYLIDAPQNPATWEGGGSWRAPWRKRLAPRLHAIVAAVVLATTIAIYLYVGHQQRHQPGRVEAGCLVDLETGRTAALVLTEIEVGRNPQWRLDLVDLRNGELLRREVVVQGDDPSPPRIAPAGRGRFWLHYDSELELRRTSDFTVVVDHDALVEQIPMLDKVAEDAKDLRIHPSGDLAVNRAGFLDGRTGVRSNRSASQATDDGTRPLSRGTWGGPPGRWHKGDDIGIDSTRVLRVSGKREQPVEPLFALPEPGARPVVDVQTGYHVAWRSRSTGKLEAFLLFSSKSRRLRRVDLRGRVLWTLELPEPARFAHLVGDTLVLLVHPEPRRPEGEISDRLIGVDIRSGKARWTHRP